MDYEIFEAGDVVLQCQQTLRNAKLAYKTFGTLNANKDNVIVYPTWYSGQHYENEWLIGEGKALDPNKYFIIIPNLLGNGLSSSPSNTPPPFDKARFPNITFYDNVRLQHRLVTEKFGIETIELVTGWSMGAGQTYQWGALYPDMVKRICPFLGSAKTSRHNIVFLEGVKAALTADDAWQNGWYEKPPTKGLRGNGARLCWLGFFSSILSRKVDLEKMGYASLEDFLIGFWENLFFRRDANNLLTMLWTWQQGDISNNELYHGDFDKALSAITSKAIVITGKHDLYFPPEDNIYEVEHMPNAELRQTDSVWGHFAGGPRFIST
jgi:homoserine O-acetyltransferase